MEKVKSYKKINSEAEHLNFAISRMQDIYMKRNGETDEPHRHDYFTILIVEKAKGIHKIDFNTYELGVHQVFFVAPGQVHQVIESVKSYGYAMTFSNQFLVENTIPLAFIESLNLFQNYGHSPPLLPQEEQFNSILFFAEKIFELVSKDLVMKNLSIGAYLKLLLIECNNICSINPVFEQDATGTNIIRNFRNSVNENYKKEHSASFYADLQFITPDHLNRIVKAKIGKTAKEFIQARIITEAKRLLYFTDLNTKEIGYQLGFNVPANFSAFFKKNTGVSPSNFKTKEILV